MKIDHLNSAFLLIEPSGDARSLAVELGDLPQVHWISAVYGPFPVVAYAMENSRKDLETLSESVRVRGDVRTLDVRLCKAIPGDEDLQPVDWSLPERAALLINVNLKEERERVVTWRLRDISGVRLARAMWGPTDIVALVEATDSETMRNLICDSIKTMHGVASTTTLYCYSNS